MKEINLGRILIENRHKRGITQEELAEYIGVSKAAVSKWEIGMTYPDISLLPRLASYFNISIDELMGYKPQMDTADIRKWYSRLAKEFAEGPFEDALEHCRELAKKYCACDPLLFHIGSLLVNHAMLAGTQERSSHVLEEAKAIFSRVRTDSTDPKLGKEALQMEAYCLLALQQPAEALDLLEEDSPEIGPAEPLLASAYQMTGNTLDAKRVLQAGIYKQVVAFCNLLPSYMNLSMDDPERFEKLCTRFQAVADAFQLQHLHPGLLLSCYFIMARGWAVLGESGKALDMLGKYTDLATSSIYPLHLHGDSFFDLLDEWFHDVLILGTTLPRDDMVIRHSMTQALKEDPAFEPLKAEPRFQNMVSRLEQNEGET